MEKLFPIFPHNGKIFSTVWKTWIGRRDGAPAGSGFGCRCARRARGFVVAGLCAASVWAEEPARLALDLAAEGQRAAAAVEFRRLALAADSTENTAGWYWLAAYEYAQGGRPELSNRMLDRGENAAPLALAVPVAWLRAENAMDEKDWAAAAFHFDSLRLKADTDDLRNFAARGAAAARLRDRDIAGAKQALDSAPGDPGSAQVAIDRYAARRDKRPWLGGVLGLVPGLGYAYSGEYANAARSLILNSLFLWGMVETATDDQWGLFAVLTFAEFTWYSGSIYGGIDAAHRHNQRRLDVAVDGIRGEQHLRPDLVRVPIVSLQWAF